MSRLLARHFVAETYRLVGSVVTVLVLIYLGNRLTRYLADIAAGELVGAQLLTLLGLKLLVVLVILLPAAFYLGLLLVLGRMHSDSEMVALAASGVGPPTIYRYCLLSALPVALVTGWLSLQLVPSIETLLDRTLQRTRVEALVEALAPGRFASAGNGLVYHLQGVDADGLKGLFLQLRQGDETMLIGARSGRLEGDPERGELALRLVDGHRYDGRPGRGDYRVFDFDRYRVRMATAAARTPAPRVETESSFRLWAAATPEAVAELQWRLAQPVLVLVLALLAVPIAEVRPRQGRYARLVAALLVYVVYLNLLAAGRTLLAGGELPAVAGLWWVHLPFVGLVGVLAWRQLRPRRTRVRAAA